MAPRAYTGSRSGNRRTAARARTRSSAARQTRPLTPSLTSGNTPVLSPSILSRPQGVTVNNNEDVQARVDSAFEASMQARNRDNDLAAAVSGLLLLGATSSAATTTCRNEAALSSTTQGPSRPTRKNKGSKRQKLDTSQSRTTVSPMAELSMQSFNTRQVINRRTSPQFNIFQAILQHVHIVFHFVTCLDVDTLVSLYAISKDLHNMVNTCTSAVILAQAMRYAPRAASTFPFRCYRKLCNDDPRVDLDVTRGQSRLIPSFRWLRIIHWRHQVAHKIVQLLNEEGLYLPEEGETAIEKIWFLMDIPDNQRRLATIQNPDLWTTADLFYACMFFMRIDMRCTDPLFPRAHANIRRMLMAQPSMTMTCRVLERKFLLNKHEVIETYMRWKYTAVDGHQPNVFGVPQRELGLLQYEGYGKEGSRVKLQRPDELVLKECVRRGMQMETAFFCMLNYVGPRQADVTDTPVADAAHGNSNAQDHGSANAHVSVATASANNDDDDVTMTLDEADM